MKRKMTDIDACQAAPDPVTRPAWPRHPYRWLLAGIGVVSTGLAALGAMLPGLPTTVFLIVASYCFAKSCPWLEERLLRNRLFAPYMAWVDGRVPMSRRARTGAIAAIWIAVSSSLVVLQAAGRLPFWLAATIVIAAVIGTLAIWLDIVYRMRGTDEKIKDKNMKTKI